MDDAAVWVSPDALHPWPGNPRRNDLAAQKLAEWLRPDPEGRWTSPIAARADGTIIAGHTLWKAATLLGLERVPVRYLDVDERTAYQLALADNTLGEVAEWDDAALARVLDEWADLPTAEAMGWDSYELGKLADAVPNFGPLDAGETPPKSCPHCGCEL